MQTYGCQGVGRGGWVEATHTEWGLHAGNFIMLLLEDSLLRLTL
ncbi:hypothetical protein Q4572_23905 [Acinetobacter guillouiae]|nr:hypothetical protein [Acinetobacter guillouiae]